MSVIRAVFFDFDDTLCDAQPAFDKAAQAAFDTIYSRHPYLTDGQVQEGWQTVHGPLFADLRLGNRSMAEVRLERFRRLLVFLGVPDDRFADELDLLLGHTQLLHLQWFNDAPATLEALQKRGLYVGVITNGAGDTHPDSQHSKAEYLGLLHRINTFWVSDNMGYRKPDPRALLPALQAAGCNPNEAFYVGDSPENDVAGANRTGVVSVLLWRSGGVLSQAAKDARPRYVINSLAELEDVLNRHNAAAQNKNDSPS